MDGFQFDPQVLPRLHAAFADALAKVDRQIELAKDELPWAGDSVSAYAAERFNAQQSSALQALQAYRGTLDELVTKLAMSAGQYQQTEDATMRSGQ
ncbi:PE domain-containing protein [Kibdelosporangium philippinense]|uniref:PE domain-containing protein n=1 Tax=Kibdelosporangium philippinense TaxID=211113 RepID=A0ABS8ZH67_9PSEU|nr:PE domain-containing protein [Kibdelosporangium philippinense]MCE7005996.1 PE domain-containing protein [Kibdelosporangium philippinense]